MAEEKKTGAQKRQVKFSGLIGSGVLKPMAEESTLGATYTTEISPDDTNDLPISGTEAQNDSIPPTPEALVPESPTPAAPAGVRRILLALIDDSPYQPRFQYDQEEIDNLSHSLAAAGLKEPIKVRPKPNGRFERIWGHRRSRAAQNIGWVEIDAYVEEMSDREAKLAVRISNCARIDLTDFELAKMYQETLDEDAAKTQTEIAYLFGTTQGHVSQRLAILKLPPTFVAMLENNPAMFQVRCANSIAQLLKEYPGEAELIETAVKRINDGADQTSVKPWVQQMIKAKNKVQQPDDAIITDKAGRAIFIANLVDRELTIKIKAPEIDAKEIDEIVKAALRQRAERISEDIING